jgi:hypothetical protein
MGTGFTTRFQSAGNSTGAGLGGVMVVACALPNINKLNPKANLTPVAILFSRGWAEEKIKVMKTPVSVIFYR